MGIIKLSEMEKTSLPLEGLQRHGCARAEIRHAAGAGSLVLQFARRRHDAVVCRAATLRQRGAEDVARFSEATVRRDDHGSAFISCVHELGKKIAPPRTTGRYTMGYLGAYLAWGREARDTAPT